MRYFEKALVYVVNLALGLLASVGFIYVLGSALGGIVISDMPVVILGLLILFNWATRYVPANFGFRLVAFVIGVVIPGINLH